MYLVYRPDDFIEDDGFNEEIYLHYSLTEKLIFALLPGCWNKISVCWKPNCDNEGDPKNNKLLCNSHMKMVKQVSPLLGKKAFGNINVVAKKPLFLKK